MLDMLKKFLPKSFLDFLRRIKIVRRLGITWVRNRNVWIMGGVGAGLRINPGFSNPDYAFGFNELPVQRVFAENLKSGDVFYDIGANIGFFTIIAAKLVGEDGCVYAFEPVPENAAYIQTNIDLNKLNNVTIDQRAVSDHTGTSDFYLSEYSGGGGTVIDGDKPPDLKGIIPVDLVSIDNLITDNHIQPPSMVKIDVEGAEIAVLKGMKNTIQEFKPILLYEIDDGDRDRFQQKQAECDQFVAKFGYTLKQLENSYPGSENWIVNHTLAIPK